MTRTDHSSQTDNAPGNVDIISSGERYCSNTCSTLTSTSSSVNDGACELRGPEHHLTIVSQNIRSVYCNFHNFVTMLYCFEIEADIIILTECHLNVDKPIPRLRGYHSHATTRQVTKCDGVVVYVRDTIISRIQEIGLSEASCLQVDVQDSIILCIYRSPKNRNHDNFNGSVDKHVQSVDPQKNLIIAGDININIRPKESEKPQDKKKRMNYLSMLSAHGVLAGHTEPTRGENCLDHCMLRFCKGMLASIDVLRTGTTDHHTTDLSLSEM